MSPHAQCRRRENGINWADSGLSLQGQTNLAETLEADAQAALKPGFTNTAAQPLRARSEQHLQSTNFPDARFRDTVILGNKGQDMTDGKSISDHWGTGDVFTRIIEAMKAAGIDPGTVTVEQLAPVDHFHARGFPATIELAKRGEVPVFGTHILLGKLAPQIVKNAARNIEEGRTHPVQIICRKTR